MKKILFVGRFFHIKSASADFFIDILRGFYIVEKWYPENDNISLSEIEKKINNYAFIICWQSEHLAYYFSNVTNVTNVVNVTMFDGVENRKKCFFELLTNCVNLNFSEEVQRRIKEEGGVVSYLKYFPDTLMDIYKKRERKETSLFFWERTPSFLSSEKVIEFFDGKVDKIYLHSPIDFNFKGKTKSTIILSDYFDSKSEFLEYMALSDFFVCPRSTEGIGMSFLDAMSLGLIPIGLDKPTFNEYVKNNINGFLCEKTDDFSVLDLKNVNLEKVRNEIIQNNTKGRKLFLDSVDQFDLKLDELFLKLREKRSIYIEELISFIERNYMTPDLCFEKMDSYEQ